MFESVSPAPRGALCSRSQAPLGERAGDISRLGKQSFQDERSQTEAWKRGKVGLTRSVIASTMIGLERNLDLDLGKRTPASVDRDRSLRDRRVSWHGFPGICEFGTQSEKLS